MQDPPFELFHSSVVLDLRRSWGRIPHGMRSPPAGRCGMLELQCVTTKTDQDLDASKELACLRHTRIGVRIQRVVAVL